MTHFFYFQNGPIPRASFYCHPFFFYSTKPILKCQPIFFYSAQCRTEQSRSNDRFFFKFKMGPIPRPSLYFHPFFFYSIRPILKWQPIFFFLMDNMILKLKGKSVNEKRLGSGMGAPSGYTCFDAL